MTLIVLGLLRSDVDLDRIGTMVVLMSAALQKIFLFRE